MRARIRSLAHAHTRIICRRALIALTKPFTPSAQLVRHARIRPTAVAGADGCCCDAADVVVVVDGAGGGGLHSQPLVALLAQQAATAVKGLTPTPL